MLLLKLHSKYDISYIMDALTSTSPPCAPTPGQRIQASGALTRTRCSAERSVAPATSPIQAPRESSMEGPDGSLHCTHNLAT